MIVLVLILALGWFLASHWVMRQALQWWHYRQSVRLEQEANAIRDGLLQRSFLLRRRLELPSETGPSAASPDWIGEISQFHQALEALSDRLWPPYLEDSLPLAIRALLESWKTRYPNLQFSLETPEDWRQDSPERSRLLLTAMDELFRILLPQASVQGTIALQLFLRNTTAELQICCTRPDDATPPSQLQQSELGFLRHAFRFLMPGTCFCRKYDHTTVWYFRWKSQSAVPFYPM